MAKRPWGTGRRAGIAAAFQLFVKHYARKARRGLDPNDRRFDRKLQRRARRMPAEELDALLRDGEEP